MIGCSYQLCSALASGIGGLKVKMDDPLVESLIPVNLATEVNSSINTIMFLMFFPLNIMNTLPFEVFTSIVVQSTTRNGPSSPASIFPSRSVN